MKPSEKIAIVGMSGKYPGADNLSKFWENIIAGKNSITEIPESRWNINAFYNETQKKKEKMYCRSIGMINDVECFDPLFFRISPAEANLMDPQHRHFLQESYRAFEDAGYADKTLDNLNCGVYLGVLHNEYASLLSQAGSGNLDSTGNNFAIAAARISYYLNLKGPAIAVDTSCSSSLVAIHLACQALANHEIDMALAGGVTLYLSPDSYIRMCQSGMLSPDGQCKTFDDDANGFVPGEGVGAVVLKRLDDAQRDGDAIYGVIIGSGINQDGKTNGITAPSVISQMELQRHIYTKNNIKPETISYVETHGTGTKLGDPIELQALATVFKEQSSEKNTCALASVKTNIGHASGAAGVAGLQKVLLSLQHKKIPPSLNIKKENTHFDFKDSPFYVNKTAKDWKSKSELPLRAAVNSFGFSGTNAHLVVEEYVEPAKKRRLEDSHYDFFVVPLSAKNPQSLGRVVNGLKVFLERNTVPMCELSYTLQTGRKALESRTVLVVHDQQDLLQKLKKLAEQNEVDVPITDSHIFKGKAERRLKKTKDPHALAILNGSIQKLEQQACITIAKMWVDGHTIDWNKLYGDNHILRTHLPTYPFAKEHYWIPQSSGNVSQSETSLIQKEQVETVSPEPVRITKVGSVEDKKLALPESELKPAIIHYLKTLFSEKLEVPIDQLDIDTDIYDWGFDSISATELLATIAKTLDDVPSDLFWDYDTIQDLSEYFYEHYKELLSHFLTQMPTAEQATETLAPPTASTEKTVNSNKHVFPELVRLNDVADGSPIFWLHAKLGGVQPYMAIAKKWNRPAYGIQARGWMTGRSPLHGIQAMGAYYVHIIQSIQPNGPYDLGGHSLGGILSYEVARQLHELGEQVTSIVMIDTPDSSQFESLKQLSVKSEMLEAVNFLLRPLMAFDTQELSHRLIHRDAVDASTSDDEFLKQLVSLAYEKGIKVKKLEEQIKKIIHVQKAYELERYSLELLPNPASVTCHYFKNSNKVFLGEMEPFHQLSIETVSLEGKDYYSQWTPFLPSMHVPTIKAENHMSILTEPESSDYISDYCNQLYNEN